MWEVVGGADKGGILVREDRRLGSRMLEERLSTGALVLELALDAGRLKYSLLEGGGPSTGWVSIRVADKPLLVEYKVPRSSSTAAEKKHLRANTDAEDPAWPQQDWTNRLVLSPATFPSFSSSCPGEAGDAENRPGPFRSVCVFGPHHSCTGAVMRELPRFFKVAVKNVHYNDNPLLWKHTVFRQAPRLSDDMFCVCLVKDPAFWIQSLSRDPAEGTFYEIQPVSCGRDSWSGEAVVLPQDHRCGSQLFGPVVFDGEIYSDALQLWEATAGAYLDENILPSSRTAVVRCEDFLFNFEGVMRDLCSRGLTLRDDAPDEWWPLESTAKDPTHPACTRRSRGQLLEYYENPANRHRGMTNMQLARLKRVAPHLLRTFGYG